MTDSKIKKCNECKSEFYADSSVMKSLCPNCAHQLYGYPNCNHKFENDKCVKCYWNGNTSDYLNKI